MTRSAFLLAACALCTAAFAGDTPSSSQQQKPRPPSEVKVELPRMPDDLARIRTTVGTFEVQEKNAELLRKMLAGEPVPVQFYAGE